MILRMIHDSPGCLGISRRRDKSQIVSGELSKESRSKLQFSHKPIFNERFNQIARDRRTESNPDFPRFCRDFLARNADHCTFRPAAYRHATSFIVFSPTSVCAIRSLRYCSHHKRAHTTLNRFCSLCSSARAGNAIQKGKFAARTEEKKNRRERDKVRLHDGRKTAVAVNRCERGIDRPSAAAKCRSRR